MCHPPGDPLPQAMRREACGEAAPFPSPQEASFPVEEQSLVWGLLLSGEGVLN